MYATCAAESIAHRIDRPTHRRPLPSDYPTAGQLDLSPQTIRRLYPHAVELVGLDGRPCWSAEDLIDSDT